ncbi:MAG TPA: regulatory protein RecX [Candidatus Polarisedimenticolaceae bacterium]|nr:regulatory protein RecX [Candidatus Polarisedimenticolaceae bacterium]
MSAYDDAVKLLARRAYSRRAIVERLAAKGYAQDDVEDALGRLSSSGAIDDREYARRFVTERGKARGRKRLLAELEAAGIEPGVASRALAEAAAEGERDDEGALLSAVRRKLGAPPGRADRGRLARVYNALLSEGFEPGRIASALVPYGFRGDDA